MYFFCLLLGVPTYTPYDRRYYGASKSRTNHSGVQPPVGGAWNPRPAARAPQTAGRDSILLNCSRVIPVYELSSDLTPPSEVSSDCNPTQPQPDPSYPGVRAFPPRYPARQPVQSSSNEGSPSYGNRRMDQGYSQTNPQDDSQTLEEIPDLRPPNQNFQTDDLPFCDEINARPTSSDLTASESTRNSKLIQPPPSLCPQRFSGLAPHLDCTKFLSCANGRTFVMDCAPGTRYCYSYNYYFKSIEYCLIQIEIVLDKP